MFQILNSIIKLIKFMNVGAAHAVLFDMLTHTVASYTIILNS